MTMRPSKQKTLDRRFGLRVENHLVQLAIATPNDQGGFDLEFDEARCPHPEGWLRSESGRALEEALEALTDRHHMRRQPVAAALDGDFCVTRITTGNSVDVDEELESLGGRIPRYLQLGPGEKVTGSCRQRLDATVDYVMTGVANRNVIQLLYEAFRSCELDVQWLEPSLVSLARLVDLGGIATAETVLIADGTGKQWDVGIAAEGRLMLDYRPAAATTEKAFRNALVGHMSRLRRYCQRHRRLESDELGKLFVCGSPEKAETAVDLFNDTEDIEASVLEIPAIEGLYRIPHETDNRGMAAVVAAVLPLLINKHSDEIADLLDHVRRAPDLSWPKRTFKLAWPAIAASVFLIGMFGLVTRQRSLAASAVQSRETLQAEIRLTQGQMSQLSTKRELVDQLVSIRDAIAEPDWELLFRQITQSLSDQARLNSFRVESDGEILLDGFVTEEHLVYDFVSALRKLPRIRQVALKRTNPESDGIGIRFLIGLNMDAILPAAESSLSSGSPSS